MKKKTAKVKKPLRRVKKTLKRSRPQSSGSFYRIVILTACLLLFIVGAVIANRRSIMRSVAGASIVRGLYVQTVVTLPKVPEAVTFNIYYKQASDSTYSNAVRDIPANVTNYTISYLKKGVNYQYKISAADSTGREFWWSDNNTFSVLQPM